MIEAVKAALQNGFTNMRLNRVDACIYPENSRSIRLVERFGFKKEGLLRDYFCLNGVFYDHYLFSLLKREWQAG